MHGGDLDGQTFAYRLVDLPEDRQERYGWELPDGEGVAIFQALLQGYRIEAAFVDQTNPNVSFNGATFNPSDGSASGPDFVNRNDLGILIAAGGD